MLPTGPLAGVLLHNTKQVIIMQEDMFDVVIIGGSYAGLSAAMALGRALKQVLVIDDGQPCNRQTPYSHNFLTQDGTPPVVIASIARQQVQVYKTVQFMDGTAIKATTTIDGFSVQTTQGVVLNAHKLVIATGIHDLLPAIDGLQQCWGISVLHCPYCHGYEVRQETTGILANGEQAFELAKLIYNWTNDLAIFTNGPSTLMPEQLAKLSSRNIKVIEDNIAGLEHIDGYLQNIAFANGTKYGLKALYVRSPFKQHTDIPLQLGCALTEDGYIQVDALQATTVDGIFACGDNASRMRTVANTVATGTTAGIAASKAIIAAAF